MKNYLFFAIFIFLTNCIFLSTSMVVYGLPTFQGAVGFGADTIGGRGGRVIEVTNLNDSGPGSFRDALKASGPRIVVFRTGGTIKLTKEINVTNPYLTVAGQTAPGGGITIRGESINFENTHDIVIRGLRFRVGGGPDTGDKDSIQIGMSYNVVVDHCSLSWAVDEIGGAFWADTHDITYSNCIVSEALMYAGHHEGNHSCGLLFSAGAKESSGMGRISVIGNLFAHNDERNPKICCDAVVANNVIYDHGYWGFDIEGVNTSPRISGVGNLFIKGPSYRRPNQDKPISIRNNSQVYLSDNDCSDYNDTGVCNTNDQYTVDSPPIWPSGFVAKPVGEVLDWVLANAGARPTNRDPVDTRIINDVINRTGSLIDSPDEVGGWPTLDPGTPPQDTDHDGMPDSWETSHGLNPNNSADGNQDRDSDGYTNIEEYINSLIPISDLTPPDTESPTIPTNLQATAVSSSQIYLSWSASTDNVGVNGYRIYRNGPDGTQIKTAPNTTYQDTGLSPSSTYTYTVSAYDAAGNESGQSTSVSATTQEAITIFSNIDSYLGNASNWEPLTPGRWDVVSDEGNLRYGINTTSYSSLSGSRLGEYSLIKNRTYEDFTFTAKVKSTEDLSSNSAADYNIVFGFQDPDNYYYMMFNGSQGSNGLNRVTNGVDQIIATASNQSISDNNYHIVKLERKGSTINVYFDNTLTLATTDSTFQGGQIGIGSFNDASLWDDIIITTSTSNDATPPLPPMGLLIQ